MSAVCVFRAIDLYAGMKDAQTQRHNIFVDVEQIVDVEYHRLLAAMRIHWQQLFAAIVWLRAAIEQRHAAEEHAHIDRSTQPLSIVDPCMVHALIFDRFVSVVVVFFLLTFFCFICG